ncbi:hypothetical protein Gotri_005262 [Gossypium trilobum]|uniref:Phytocyanin domain-containing protein n=1 Tax=Gossypium trilobum TaxID=34281 RepID=A0A7J9EVY3_9ROSI|nr:hypothetical protein [Gossypium trilobum]
MARSGAGTTMVGVVVVMWWCMVVQRLEATVFTVGESSGWVVGVDYDTWAKSKNFKLGDLLAVFDYSSAYAIDEVFENDYNTCKIDHPISSDNSGSTVISLLNAGPHYFICGTPGYCAQGMKFIANVTA